jgi:hypothetical protein
LKIILPFASFSYAFVVFDTLGDRYGWKVALGPSIFVFSLPWWFYAWKEVTKRMQRRRKKRREVDFDDDGDIFYSLQRTIAQSFFLKPDSWVSRSPMYSRDSFSAEHTQRRWLDNSIELSTNVHHPVLSRRMTGTEHKVDDLQMDAVTNPVNLANASDNS